MAKANWRARVGAWVGGFGVPGGFDATSGQRRLKGFTTSRAHVNALIAASGPEMNARARWLVRNNGYAANAIESWAANTVGTGISPNSTIAQGARKDAVQRLWLAWTDDADAEGLTDFYGLQRRAAREGFTRQMKRLPVALRRSITYDRGSEMACHPELARQLKIDICISRSPRPQATWLEPEHQRSAPPVHAQRHRPRAPSVRPN